VFKKKQFVVVLLACFSTLAAAVLGSCVKVLSNELNPFTICFYRSFLGLLLIIPFISIKNFQPLKTKNFKLQLQEA
jgi:EamA-like transporter family.